MQKQGRFHLLAYYFNQVVSADSILAAVSDPVYAIQSSQFQIPEDMKMIAAYAGGLTMTRARVVTPSLRLRGIPQIYPFHQLLLPPTDPNIMDMREWPLRIYKEENLEVDVTQITGTAHDYAGIWIAKPDWNGNLDGREARWVRFTATVVPALGAWSPLAQITLQDTLEGGSYCVWGMDAFEATTVFARLVFQNQYMRPGCLGNATLGLRSAEMFRGGMGLWGEFNTYSLPQIEVLADTAGSVTLDGKLLVTKSDGFEPPYRG